MGIGGRIACIFTPMALTIVSFVCLIFLELGGWNSSSGTLNGLYFFSADFSHLDVSSASTLANTTTLTAALAEAHAANRLADVYQIHLWNYCSSSTNGTGEDTNATAAISSCTARHAEFWFDPVTVWGLNATSATSTDNGTPLVGAAENATETEENTLLGKSGADALNAYRDVAKWMFIAFEVAFWASAATVVCGLLAICSRWGSFLTWLCSVVASVFTLGAVLTSTILFAALAGALHTVLHPYGIDVSVGGRALGVGWLAVVCSWAATLFWLFSICCCSGRSNPHHRSNKGGLWAAEPAYGAGYGGRSRAMRVEKTGGSVGGYDRVASPFLGSDAGHHDDRVPLQDYSAGQRLQPQPGYEPYRHA